MTSQGDLNKVVRLGNQTHSLKSEHGSCERHIISVKWRYASMRFPVNSGMIFSLTMHTNYVEWPHQQIIWPHRIPFVMIRRHRRITCSNCAQRKLPSRQPLEFVSMDTLICKTSTGDRVQSEVTDRWSTTSMQVLRHIYKRTA
jgi:hypothetical protein